MFVIFEKLKLRPSQLRTVAERRYGDAECLHKTRLNVRANGAIYLGGFVIECLLKAKLLEKNPWLGYPGNIMQRSKKERRLYELCYQRHNLEEILENLPELRQKLLEHDQACGHTLRLFRSLQYIVDRWTIYARYSPHMATINDADEFLSRIREVKEWLK